MIILLACDIFKKEKEKKVYTFMHLLGTIVKDIRTM